MSDQPQTSADDSALQRVVALMPFAVLLGVELRSMRPDEVVATMPFRDDLTTAGGVLHGGAQMAFADSIGAVCAFANLPPDTSTATIESKTNLFRAVTGGQLTATATPLHVGRTTIVVQTVLTDDRGRRVAHVIQTQAVIPNA